MSFFDVLGWGGHSWAYQLLLGTLTTVEISLGAYAAGLTIGCVVAIIKLYGPRWAARLANGYSTVCRAVPDIMLIIILYYSGQSALGALLADLDIGGDYSISGFAAAIVVLGLVQGAYASEIIRGAILSIPIGQVEAARAFGMAGPVLFRRIILPVMVPTALGGLTNLWMAIIKDSALISVVGYNELLFTAKQAAGSSKYYFSFFLVCAGLYYILTLASNVVIHVVERRIGRWMPRAH